MSILKVLLQLQARLVRWRRTAACMAYLEPRECLIEKAVMLD